jgi:hypothetical protein
MLIVNETYDKNEKMYLEKDKMKPVGPFWFQDINQNTF